MIWVSIHLAETIRSMVKDKPPIMSLESRDPLTVRQIARSIGIPATLIIFACADGVKISLNGSIEKDANVHLFGTIAGG